MTTGLAQQVRMALKRRVAHYCTVAPYALACYFGHDFAPAAAVLVRASYVDGQGTWHPPVTVTKCRNCPTDRWSPPSGRSS